MSIISDPYITSIVSPISSQEFIKHIILYKNAFQHLSNHILQQALSKCSIRQQFLIDIFTHSSFNHINLTELQCMYRKMKMIAGMIHKLEKHQRQKQLLQNQTKKVYSSQNLHVKQNIYCNAIEQQLKSRKIMKQFHDQQIRKQNCFKFRSKQIQKTKLLNKRAQDRFLQFKSKQKEKINKSYMQQTQLSKTLTINNSHEKSTTQKKFYRTQYMKRQQNRFSPKNIPIQACKSHKKQSIRHNLLFMNNSNIGTTNNSHNQLYSDLSCLNIDISHNKNNKSWQNETPKFRQKDSQKIKDKLLEFQSQRQKKNIETMILKELKIRKIAENRNEKLKKKKNNTLRINFKTQPIDLMSSQQQLEQNIRKKSERKQRYLNEKVKKVKERLYHESMRLERHKLRTAIDIKQRQIKYKLQSSTSNKPKITQEQVQDKIRHRRKEISSLNQLREKIFNLKYMQTAELEKYHKYLRS